MPIAYWLGRVSPVGPFKRTNHFRVLTAVGSLAVPAVHSASVVTVLMITASLDIPPANIGILLALEWFS